MNTRFDVFLSHNSKDKPAVRELWLDEWELVGVPSQPMQELLARHQGRLSTALLSGCNFERQMRYIEIEAGKDVTSGRSQAWQDDGETSSRS